MDFLNKLLWTKNQNYQKKRKEFLKKHPDSLERVEFFEQHGTFVASKMFTFSPNHNHDIHQLFKMFQKMQK